MGTRQKMHKWTNKQTASCGYVRSVAEFAYGIETEVCGAEIVLFSMEDDPEDKWTHGLHTSLEDRDHVPVPVFE